MRSAILFTWILLMGVNLLAQHNIIDSLQKELKKANHDTSKAILLYQLSYEYQGYKPDSGLLLAQEAYDLSLKHHFLKGQSWALNQIAGAFGKMGNSAQSLEYYIRQLKIEEERNEPENIAVVNMNIALVYNSEKDTAKAISYILKADSLIQRYQMTDLQLYVLLNKGEIFEKANRLSEALKITKQCYDTAVEHQAQLIKGTALNNLGNIFFKLGNYEEAVKQYQNSYTLLLAQNDYLTISEGRIGLARAYSALHNTDSALIYSWLAYAISSHGNFLKNALEASRLLSILYKGQNKIDSAFAYQEITFVLRDSIESIEKIKRLESVSLEEQLRQKHIMALAEQEKEEQHQRLQLLSIGIFIPLFFLLSLYISRKRIPKKVIEFSGVLSLLLLFEYITLLIHPFVAEITHHTPVYEILILVCVAALVVPAHHKIEHWFIQRLSSINEKHSTKPLPVTENEEDAVMEEEGMDEKDEDAASEDKPASSSQEQ